MCEYGTWMAELLYLNLKLTVRNIINLKKIWNKKCQNLDFLSCYHDFSLLYSHIFYPPPSPRFFISINICEKPKSREVVGLLGGREIIFLAPNILWNCSGLPIIIDNPICIWKGHVKRDFLVCSSEQKEEMVFCFQNCSVYCEKKSFFWLIKTFEIQGWRVRICKFFEINTTVYSNSERSEQFIKQKGFSLRSL